MPSDSIHPYARDTVGDVFASYGHGHDDEGEESDEPRTSLDYYAGGEDEVVDPFQVPGATSERVSPAVLQLPQQSYPPSSPSLSGSASPSNSPFLGYTSSDGASSPPSDSPRPSDSQWLPPPRKSSVRSNNHNASSSALDGRNGAHLRQRSVPQTVVVLGTDRDADEARNPFGDRFHKPHHAAWMNGGSQNGDGESLDHATSSVMRGDRAEWLPTQHHLYSESSLSHDDASRILGSPVSHASYQSSVGKASKSRYDLSALSPSLLASYEKGRYTREADDALHDVGELGKREGAERRITETAAMRGPARWSMRGWANFFGIGVLVSALVMLFAGYPVYSYFTTHSLSNFGAAGLGGTNASGQVPKIPSYRGLIDSDTPESALTRTGYDGRPYQLVFSDEFNQAGRTFYPGEDPYWEAVDLHYWQTNDMEWYDPDAITTKNGYLAISLTKEALADSHGNGFLSGMLQSWNKFCFTGGMIEVAISLPGDNQVPGLWPAAWTMSNLGRAGYGGSLDGTWPYVYEECDIGTLANQTDPKTGGPLAVTTTGDPTHGDNLSFLPGQRLSACTCPGESHPGPVLANGSFVGRGAAEIDIFEATVNTGLGIGEISQSAQWAPFNPHYTYLNKTTSEVQFFSNSTFNPQPNSYLGGAFQQVTSGLSATDGATYNSTTNFGTYGFEYQPSYINGYGTGEITWMQGGQPQWKLSDTAMAGNPATMVSNRLITGEPMYILLNLGMSRNFGFVDLANLVFPAVMRVDYVRVYQPNGQINVGCSPPLYPTADYIKNNPKMYNDPNVTVMADLGQKFPKNRLIDTC